MTWCNRYDRFTVRFSSSCWGLGWPSIGVSARALLDHSPTAHVRRPRLDYESHATGLDRNELGALLVAAGLGPPAEHAL